MLAMRPLARITKDLPRIEVDFIAGLADPMLNRVKDDVKAQDRHKNRRQSHPRRWQTAEGQVHCIRKPKQIRKSVL